MPMNEQITQTVRGFFEKSPVKRLKAGELVLSPSTHVQEVYFLTSGYVREYMVSEQGVELTVHIYEKGAAFPMLPVVHNLENQHYFDVLGDCELFVAPGKDFIAYLKAHPDVMFDMLGRLLLGLQGLVKRIEYLTLSKASSRLAACLLYLGRHFGAEEHGQLVLSQRFTHHEIASIVGLARETVSLELEQMMAKGFIVYNGRFIVIAQPLELQRLLES